jgi:hypothetical protein
MILKFKFQGFGTPQDLIKYGRFWEILHIPNINEIGIGPHPFYERFGYTVRASGHMETYYVNVDRCIEYRSNVVLEHFFNTEYPKFLSETRNSKISEVLES